MNSITPQLVELLNKYSDCHQDGQNLDKLLSRIADSKPIIPILGVQGVGKSTLINALLGEQILPAEAAETTCVPVEVKYGEKKSIEVFKKNDDKPIEISADQIQDYVDNDNNNANEKRVERVVVSLNKSILKGGAIIVDLPGVGSLTQTNEDTTLEYIQNVCASVFVISTTPTITRPQANCIKMGWQQFSKAIFVQNAWEGESKEEIAEALTDNANKINEIAQKLHNKFDDKIIVVNVWAALNNKTEEGRRSSNIDELVNSINTLASQWQDTLEKSANDTIVMTVDAAIKYANRIVQDCKRNHDEVICDRESELKKLNYENNQLEERFSEIKSLLGQKESDIRSFAREKASKCKNDIRKDMDTIIDGGAFDGDSLKDSFKEVQQERTSECMEAILDELASISFEVQSKIDDLIDLSFDDDTTIATEVFAKNKAFKYEKGLSSTCAIGGAYLGSFIPGVGNAIGAAIGASVGWIVGKLCGSSVCKKRARETKREMEPYYDKIESAIKEATINKFKVYSHNVKSHLDNILNEKRKLEKFKQDNLNVFEDASKIGEIEKDIEVLTNYKSAL